MDLITKTTAIKLRSHIDKYLVADDDRTTVRLSRNSITRRSIWLIEPSPAAVRLKNCATGCYLAASDLPFLLGMTGKRVIQSPSSISHDETANFTVVLDWEPIRDGFQIKLRAGEGRFLRANGGTPPWRNSVTHDTASAGGSAIWDVEAVEAPMEGEGMEVASPMSSFDLSEVSDDDSGFRSVPASPVACLWNPRLSMNKSAMDYFTNAKAVRLRSHHGKYLTADEHDESVIQFRNGASPNARWSVELISDSDDHPFVLRLKSRYGKYLTASNEPFLLGVTGRRVTQTLPSRLDSSVEWEPVRQGSRVKLRTRYGNFLRANGGLPPWRNSVTHDVPHRSSTQDWIFWDVDIIENNTPPNPKPKPSLASPLTKPASVHPHQDSFGSDASFEFPSTNAHSRQEPAESLGHIPPRSDERVIYYLIAEEDGSVNEELGQGYALQFKGKSVAELTEKLREDTGIRDIIVCSRSPVNGKLYPLRLQLPPNAVSMQVVVVPSGSSDGAV